jgi:hypothetical protein
MSHLTSFREPSLTRAVPRKVPTRLYPRNDEMMFKAQKDLLRYYQSINEKTTDERRTRAGGETKRDDSGGAGAFELLCLPAEGRRRPAKSGAGQLALYLASSTQYEGTWTALNELPIQRLQQQQQFSMKASLQGAVPDMQNLSSSGVHL